MLEAVRNECSLEEVARFLVFVRSLSAAYLTEVGRELSLLKASARYVRMGRDDFAPGLQSFFGLPLGWRKRQLASLGSRLLVESHAQQFLLAPFHLGGLFGRDCAE